MAVATADEAATVVPEDEAVITPVAQPATPEPQPVVAAATVVAAAVVAPAFVPRFELATGELQAIAHAAGLEWVGSDTDKVREAQEAIAREPKPIHVPREPRPVEVLDEGPLVLVETRRDLSQVSLPFENESSTGA